MLDKVQKVIDRHAELQRLLSDPAVLTDQPKAKELGRELRMLEPIVALGQTYMKAAHDLEGSKELLAAGTDPALKEMAQEEYDRLKVDVPRMEEELKLLLVPQDPNDSRNFIMEIRAGTGGNRGEPPVSGVGAAAGSLERSRTRVGRSTRSMGE